MGLLRRLVPAAALVLAAGCGSAGNPTSPGAPAPGGRPGGGAPPTPAEAFPAYAVTATRPQVEVHAGPGGPVVATLANPRPSGAPLTFLLEHRAGDWLHVYLPTRPNGSTGWVRAADGLVRGVPYRVDVLRGAHVLRLFDRGRLRATYPIAVGAADTPTPGGVFYLAELLAPTNPGGFYGPYAYGLSGHSTTLASFDGQDAVIGLHGTSQPWTIGHDVSHGCIRLRNADITALARLLPLGTPVRILA